MKAYQFAILRYRHSASSGEFVNVGVVLWVPSEAKLLHAVSEHYGRLSKFFSDLHGPTYRQMVKLVVGRFQEISAARATMGRADQTSLLDVMPELLLPDASCFQWSHVMSGIAPRPMDRLMELRREFVDRHVTGHQRQRRGEAEIWEPVEAALNQAGLLPRVQHDVPVEAPLFTYNFKMGWSNGHRQFLEPISLDYTNRPHVIDKANTWTGRLHNLEAAPMFQLTGIVAPPDDQELLPAYDEALGILNAAPRVRRLYTMDEIDQVVEQIQRDIASHR